MAETKLDTRGLKCPQPTLKMTATAMTMKKGDTLTVLADCASFEADVRKWVDLTKNVLISIRDQDGHKVATIRL
jgi:tRNA 2-thiouridine synthesizing protein A